MGVRAPATITEVLLFVPFVADMRCGLPLQGS